VASVNGLVGAAFPRSHHDSKAPLLVFTTSMMRLLESCELSPISKKRYGITLHDFISLPSPQVAKIDVTAYSGLRSREYSTTELGTRSIWPIIVLIIL
jgi:hypothetical protein